MATDFALCLRRFLTTHLAGLRGCSPNTVASYRDTFKLLIAYYRDERSTPPGKLTLDCIDAAAITGFLHGSRAAGTTAHQRATSGWQRSVRSARGCKPKTPPGWPATKTSSPSPPRNRPTRTSTT